MNLWQEYLRPTTVSEALQALKTASGPAIEIAGGTDLLLDLQQGRHSPVHTLVDLNSIAEMTALELREDELFIGASVPVNRIVLDPLAGAHAEALIEAARLIGGPQVRNTATLGGNVAHALPAADGTIALTALNTQAEIASLSGTRRVPFTNRHSKRGRNWSLVFTCCKSRKDKPPASSASCARREWHCQLSIQPSGLSAKMTQSKRFALQLVLPVQRLSVQSRPKIVYADKNTVISR